MCSLSDFDSVAQFPNKIIRSRFWPSVLLALRHLQTEAQRHAGPTDFLKFMVTVSPPQPHNVGVRHTFVGLTSERCWVKLESRCGCVFVTSALHMGLIRRGTIVRNSLPPPILYNTKKAFVIEGRRVWKAATNACGGHTCE